MLHYYRFHRDLPAPVPAKEAYNPRTSGRGWPEECPPLRAANSFGWDVLAAFDMEFRRDGDRWRIARAHEVESDWAYSASDDSEGVPLKQTNAWFWDENQELPHRISPQVQSHLRDQVKVSTFLFIATDPNELLYMTSIPNRETPWRAMSCIVETDWYPASYPWHCVLELGRGVDEVKIAKGEPICRLFPVRRDAYFAREMATEDFERFFRRGQEWLATHGRGEDPEMLDITRNYGKQQHKASFAVII